MSIDVQLNTDNNTYTITINGLFDFKLANAFRDAYSNISGRDIGVVVDMRNVTCIDSSALGMLLIMKKTLDLPDRAIKIINNNEYVGKIFRITRFDKKFCIE